MKQENEYEKTMRLMRDYGLLKPTANKVFTIATEPEYAGGYLIGKEGSVKLLLQKKPSWIARTMSRVLLEWYWVDTVK